MPRYSKKEIFSTVNMIPYIDVMLVLLIIFMVATPLHNMGLTVHLPKASAEKIQITSKPVVFSITDEKKYFLQHGEADRQEVQLGQESVVKWLADHEIPKDTTIYVQADKQLVWQYVLDAMLFLNQSGWSKITLVTEPDSAD